VTSGPEDRRTLERALSDLAPGESSVITGITGDPAIARRLMELGLVPGTPVEVVRRAPLGDPVELRVREIHLSIRRSEASRIRVAQA
jgi:ferrous iron transport protein A